MEADQQTPPTNVNVTGGTTPPPASPAPGSPELPSAFSLFRPSWEGLKQNLLELIVIFVVPALVAGILFVIGASAGQSSGAIGVPFIVLGVLVVLAYIAFIGPALVHIQLKSSLMEKASFASAWETSKKYWWRFLLLSLAVGLTITVGFILLIIPGIIFWKRYILSTYAMIDQDLGVGDSMRTSNELSKNRSMAVYGVMGVNILINIPSVIPIVGGIISFVLQVAYLCAPAIRYQELKATRGTQPAAAQTVAPAATNA